MENTRLAPFRFEDLNGKPEPESWGPLYPKTASAAVEKWRKTASLRELDANETRAYGAAVHAWINGLNEPKKTPGTLSTTSNCASGQAHDFNAKAYRATMLARLHAEAATDRREWALGKAKNRHGETIRDVYARVMATKGAKHYRLVEGRFELAA
jgi:hypothetical protein